MADLEALKQHCKALLLAEVAAWLHDMGKFCNLHIETHSKGGTKKWSNDHAYKVVVDQPRNYIRLSKAAAHLRKPGALNNVLNAKSPKLADYLPNEAKNSLMATVSLLEETCSLDELIMLSTPGFATDPNRAQLLDGKDGWLGAVLGVCHNEAHHDKQEPARGEGAQTWPDVFISTAFGYEEQKVIVNPSLSGNLDQRLQRLPWSDLLSLRSALHQEFVYGLGDTRRPINEVTLADWSATVAALYKSALATCLLESRRREVRQWVSWRDRLIDHDFRWRLLRVNFGVLGLFAKAIRIADLLGYRNAVDEAYVAVKQLVEEEYPLGNEVYRDTTGIYFTFPDVDLPADLAQEIRNRVERVEMELAPHIAVTEGDGNTATEQLKGILGKARREALKALAQPFDPQNLSACWQQQWTTVGEGQWELCPVCRLRPMKEGKEACETCLRRRGSRIQAWKDNPQQTIWMDEIADANDRVALIVGRFGLEAWLSGDLVQTMLVRADPATNTFTPKNPSPARLRRVWETCQRFWSETVVGTILARQSFGGGDALRCKRVAVVPGRNDWQEGVPYDGTINGKPVSLFWQESEKRFITISNLQLGVSQAWDEVGLVGEGHGRICTVSLPDKPAQTRTFTVQQVQSLSGEPIQTYAPYLSLLESPDRFLALVPASEALEIVGKIRDEYKKQMGKVQNRLPLFLGIVFFPRKLPLIAVMDTARRMLETPLGSARWEVSRRDDRNPTNAGWPRTVSLHFTNGVEWAIQTVMGDDETPDIWYPYFAVDGTPPGRSYSFQHNTRWMVHIRDLQPNDEVFVTPSRFAYLFLESTAQRFRFDPERDVMLLDELPRLRQMWDKIRHSPDMTDTKLHAIHALFEAKRQEWGLAEPTSDHPITDPTYRQLVETTLKRDRVQGVTAEDVLSGRFHRCLDLHLRILKQRVK